MADIVIHNANDLAVSGNLVIGNDSNNVLTGGSGADIIAGGKGADTIEGGAGDDILIGGELKLIENGANAGKYNVDGAGADTFVFNFTLNQATAQTLYFRDGDTPNANANISAWQNYMDQLAAWREQMFAEHGADSDPTENGNAVYTVKKVQDSLGTYDNSYSVAGGWTIAAHDGNDRILAWGDGDTLELKGLGQLATQAEFDALFDVALNGDGNTVLSWSGGSITIDGMAIANVADFWAAGTTNGWFV